MQTGFGRFFYSPTLYGLLYGTDAIRPVQIAARFSAAEHNNGKLHLTDLRSRKLRRLSAD